MAFDAARSARRLGGTVTMVFLESEDKSTRDGIPADEEEIKGAMEEGIELIPTRGVRAISAKGGRFNRINCPKCVSVFDDYGFNPQFDLEDTIDVEGDVLIVTIGQAADRELLKSQGLLDENGRLAVDASTLQSLRNPPVFIGGDVRVIGKMVEAMKEGNEAAESIHRYIRGLNLHAGRQREYEPYDIPRRNTYLEPGEIIWLPPEERMNFQLFEKGLTLQEAIVEARRCATCGPCASCKACISIGFEESLYPVEVDTDLCSGCGSCVYVCNYDAVRLIDNDGKLLSETDLFCCKSCGMCVAACPSGARSMAGDSTEKRIEKAYSELS